MIGFLKWLPRSLTKRLIHLAALLRNAQTLGVRVVVFDGDGRVLLVRHSYLPGWYLPGGGVDVGEPAPEAACRELMEETGLEAASRPELLGFFHNRRASRRDHVAFYRISRWEIADPARVPNREIVEMGFFAPNALPEDVTPSTRQRLLELAGETEVSPIW